MALKIVGSSPIIHPIKNGHPFRVSIFYGIRRIMGLEEGDGSTAAHVSKPLDIPTLERTIKSVLSGKFSGDTCSPEEDNNGQ